MLQMRKTKLTFRIGEKICTLPTPIGLYEAFIIIIVRVDETKHWKTICSNVKFRLIKSNGAATNPRQPPSSKLSASNSNISDISVTW